MCRTCHFHLHPLCFYSVRFRCGYGRKEQWHEVSKFTCRRPHFNFFIEDVRRLSETSCGRKGHEILVQTHEESAYSPIFREYTVSTIYEADLWKLGLSEQIALKFNKDWWINVFTIYIYILPGKKKTHVGHRGQIKCFNYNQRFFQDNIQYFSNGWIPHSSDISSHTQKCIFIITSTHRHLPLSLIMQGQAVVFDFNV